MVTATITSKGQITIPKYVREKLHLQSGDKVQFLLLGDTHATLKPVTKSVDAVFGALRKANTKPHSVAEMNAAISQRLRDARP